MKFWRGRFKIDNIVTSSPMAYCTNSGKFEPLGLMGHIRSKVENTSGLSSFVPCVLHYGLLRYMEKLYGNLRGIGHKALYSLNDANYKKAEEKETNEKIR